MGIDPRQLRELIADVLTKAGLHSPQALELLMGTAAQESRLGTYLYQLGNGPARGIFQMEPATEQDVWHHYLRYKPNLADTVARVCSVAVPSSWALETNLAYQVIMARLHYHRVKSPLPEADDIAGMGKYWDDHYNCNPDKGTVAEFVANYEKYCR